MKGQPSRTASARCLCTDNVVGLGGVEASTDTIDNGSKSTPAPLQHRGGEYGRHRQRSTPTPTMPLHRTVEASLDAVVNSSPSAMTLH